MDKKNTVDASNSKGTAKMTALQRLMKEEAELKKQLEASKLRGEELKAREKNFAPELVRMMNADFEGIGLEELKIYHDMLLRPAAGEEDKVAATSPAPTEDEAVGSSAGDDAASSQTPKRVKVPTRLPVPPPHPGLFLPASRPPLLLASMATRRQTRCSPKSPSAQGQASLSLLVQSPPPLLLVWMPAATTGHRRNSHIATQ
uniref:Uncharacterized protein n=1 Tax=Zea mays TaxID=4577 RepID=A0A804PGM1_MAIZE